MRLFGGDSHRIKFGKIDSLVVRTRMVSRDGVMRHEMTARNLFPEPVTVWADFLLGPNGCGASYEHQGKDGLAVHDRHWPAEILLDPIRGPLAKNDDRRDVVGSIDRVRSVSYTAGISKTTEGSPPPHGGQFPVNLR